MIIHTRMNRFGGLGMRSPSQEYNRYNRVAHGTIPISGVAMHPKKYIWRVRKEKETMNETQEKEIGCVVREKRM